MTLQKAAGYPTLFYSSSLSRWHFQIHWDYKSFGKVVILNEFDENLMRFELALSCYYKKFRINSDSNRMSQHLVNPFTYFQTHFQPLY